MSSDLPVAPPYGFPKIDRDSLLRFLQGNRESNYDVGLEMLKEKMVPALQGHDYVTPTTPFDDTQTNQEFSRGWAAGNPSYDKLKMLELQMQNNLKFSSPDGVGGFQNGFNSNDRT